MFFSQKTNLRKWKSTLNTSKSYLQNIKNIKMLHYEYKELLQFIKKMAENSIKNDSILEHKYSNENNHN